MAKRLADSFPQHIEPQLAKLAKQPPAGGDWLHEIKHDGNRLMAYIDASNVRLITRGGHNWTNRFPDIAAELARLKASQAILDAELCALESDGRTSFHRLQSALSSKGSSALVLYVFDLLYLNGRDLRRLPLTDRKAALAPLLKRHRGNRLVFVESIQADGPEFLRQCCAAGLEGIVSKRPSGRYRSGPGDWQKCKCNVQEKLVVGGFTYGRNKKSLGELLMGRREGRKLTYAGRVAFGLGGNIAKELLGQLESTRQPACPFNDKEPRDGQWVKPVLKAEIEYSTQSKACQLRRAVFRRLVG